MVNRESHIKEGGMKMLKYFKIIIVVISIFNFGVGSAQSQNPPDILFDLYVESVLNPESFDNVIQNNQNLFDQDFSANLSCVMNTLFQEAKDEIEICNQHINPEWRKKCMDENIAVGLYYWCRSIFYVIYANKRWANTWMGEIIIFSKRLIEQTGMLDYEETAKWAISLVESQIRLMFDCN